TTTLCTLSLHDALPICGKDPTKVDRSAAYMARYIAKNIVAADLAQQCEVQLSYAIGYADPLNIWVSTYGTAAHGLTEDQFVELRSEEHTSELQSPCNLV